MKGLSLLSPKALCLRLRFKPVNHASRDGLALYSALRARARSAQRRNITSKRSLEAKAPGLTDGIWNTSDAGAKRLPLSAMKATRLILFRASLSALSREVVEAVAVHP